MAAGLAVGRLRTNSETRDSMWETCRGGRTRTKMWKNGFLFETNIAEMTKMNRLLNFPFKLCKPLNYNSFDSFQLENNYIIISSLLFIWQPQACAWKTQTDSLWQNNHFTIIIILVVSVCSWSDGGSLTAQLQCVMPVLSQQKLICLWNRCGTC